MDPNYTKVEKYLTTFASELKVDPLLKARILEEARDHLYSSVERLQQRGVSFADAQIQAINQFGNSRDLKRYYSPFMIMYRFFLQIGAVLSLLASVLIFVVTILILPGNNDDQILPWVLVGFFFLIYGVLTFGYVQNKLHRQIKNAVVIFSVVALVTGVFFFVRQIIASFSNEDVEGYIIIFALILIGHALGVFLDTWHAHRRIA